MYVHARKEISGLEALLGSRAGLRSVTQLSDLEIHLFREEKAGARPLRQRSWISNLTPFDTNWKRGSSATPLTTQDLFCGVAISISTAPTNHLRYWSGLNKFERGQKGADKAIDPVLVR